MKTEQEIRDMIKIKEDNIAKFPDILVGIENIKICTALASMVETLKWVLE
jgi:hypothetical protein